MNCTRCGKANPAGAAFCMQCGQPLSAARPAAQPMTAQPMPAAPVLAAGAFDAQRKRNTAIAIGAGFAALIAAAILGAGALGLLKVPGRLPQGGQLMAAGALPPPVLQKPAQGMPQDVEDWLKHLQETERRKRVLTSRQYAELSQMPAMMQLGVSSAAQVDQLSDPDQMLDKTPQNQSLQDTIADDKPAWYRLNDFFMSKPAPAECVTIQQNYSLGLCQIGDTMGDIGKIVDSLNPMSPNLNSDVKSSKQDVYQIEQTHRETIDESFKKALYGVDDVCKKYGKTRWFDIDASGGGSDILGDYMGGGAGAAPTASPSGPGG